MKKIIFILILLPPYLFHAQSSFVKKTSSEYEIKEIRHLTQLSNGNFCLRTLEDDISVDNSRIERVYLFDQCGKYLNHIEYLFNTISLDTFHEFENIIEFDSKICITGIRTGGLPETYYLQLDPNDLSLVGDIGYYGKKYLTNDSKIFNDVLYQVSANDVDLGLAVLNKNLERKIMLSKENWDPDFRYYIYQDATENSVFAIQVDDNNTGQHISISDYELNQTHLIKLKNENTHRKYHHLVLIDDSTYICTFDEVANNTNTTYIAKYKMDEELSKRILLTDEPSFTKGAVRKIENNLLHIFTIDGWHRIYDLDGNFNEQTRVIPDSISTVPTSFLTFDGGLVTANQYWEKIGNKWFVSINLMKLNSDWRLSIENDHCFTSTLDIPERKINVSVYPNPTSGSFSIRCDNPFNRLIIYKNDASIVVDKSYPSLVDSDRVEIEGNGLFTVIVHDINGNKISTRLLKI